jgi:hypothetical protein
MPKPSNAKPEKLEKLRQGVTKEWENPQGIAGAVTQPSRWRPKTPKEA